jgi:hypothetical protein
LYIQAIKKEQKEMNDNFFLKIGLSLLPAFGVILGFAVAMWNDPVTEELKKVKDNMKPTIIYKECNCHKGTY